MTGSTNVVTLTHGDDLYTTLLQRIRADTDLVAAMWADAESTPDELDVPGNRWTVTLVDGDPAGWCAARTTNSGRLKCHSNYAVRAHRGHGHYEAAYHARHRDVVAPTGLLAVTYLFDYPIPLHEADGWRRTDLTGPGALPDHQWWELHRPAGAT